jgi:hypothetical protein
MLGITRERIARSPALVFQIGENVPTGYRFRLRSELRDRFSYSFLMMPKKPMARTVRFLPGKLVQPAVHLFPSATEEAFRLITMVFK